MMISNEAGNKNGASQKYLSSIPLPFKSPKRMRLTERKPNIMVCSTPLNKLKIKHFQNENLQLSPIKKSSPTNLISDKHITEEQICKISNKIEVKKKVNLTSQPQVSVYKFPLVNNLKRLDMKLCDSEEDTELKTIEVTKNKRNKKKLVVDGIKSFAKTSKSEEHIKQNCDVIKTRSKSVLTKENIPEKETNPSSTLTQNNNDFSFGDVNTSKNIKEVLNDKTRNSFSYSGIKNKTNTNIAYDEKLNNISIVSPINNLETAYCKNNIKNSLERPEEPEENETNIEFVKVSNQFPQINQSQKSNDDLSKNIEIVQNKNSTKKSTMSSTGRNIGTNVKPAKMDQDINLNNVCHASSSYELKQVKSEKKIRKHYSASVADGGLVRRSGRNPVPSSYATWVADMQQLNEKLNKNKKKRSRHRMPYKRIKKSEQIKCEENLDARSQLLLKPEIEDTKPMKILTDKDIKVVRKSSRICKKNTSVADIDELSEKIKHDLIPEQISNEIPIVDPIIVNLSKVSSEPGQCNKESKTRKKQHVKVGTARKNKKYIYSKRKVKFVNKNINKHKKPQNVQNTLSSSGEESTIPLDTLLIKNVTNEKNVENLSDKTRKRKGNNQVDLNHSKKVRLDNEISFKSMAQMVDIAPLKTNGIVDVEINEKTCAIGCFGRFPREFSTNSKNTHVSVGVSLTNALITTGILEIEPKGNKKYEYSKKTNLIFIILQGIAEVGIKNSSKVLRLGQDFFVPKNTPYYIINVSNTDKLLLHFSKF